MEDFVRETKNKRFSPTMIKEFLDQGLDINGTNKKGVSPLENALFKGSITNMDYLFQAGAQLNEKCQHNLLYRIVHDHQADSIWLQKLDYLLATHRMPKPQNLVDSFPYGVAGPGFSEGLCNLLVLLVTQYQFSLKDNQDILAELINFELADNLFVGFYHNFKYVSVEETPEKVNQWYLTKIQRIIDLGFDTRLIDFDRIQQKILLPDYKEEIIVPQKQRAAQQVKTLLLRNRTKGP